MSQRDGEDEHLKSERVPLFEIADSSLGSVQIQVTMCRFGRAKANTCPQQANHLTGRSTKARADCRAVLASP